MKTLAVCFLTAAVLFGQSEKKKLTFEVVSIKPHKPSDDPTFFPRGGVGRYNASNAHLRQLIVAAYVDSEAAFQGGVEISGLPGWAATEGFDIQAKAEAGFSPTKQQTMEMLQLMLEDRFKLKIRREPKSAPIYALVVDTGGFKLKEQQTSSGSVRPPQPGQLLAPSIPVLATALTFSAGRKVVDKTGLTGLYRIALTYAPDPLPPGVEFDPGLPSRCLPHFESNWASGSSLKQGRLTRSWWSPSKGHRRIDMKALTLLLLIAAVLVAQSEKKKLTFEVVSIKPNNSGETRRTIQMMPPAARFTALNATLRQLIVAAYVPNAGPLSSPEISGLPGWATTDGYDVQAQPEAGFTPTKEQAMEMLQSMLEDRFKLKIRRQPKDMPIYALVVDKGGVKMPATRATQPGRINFGYGQLSASALTAASLVPILTQAAGRKVVDKTGLTELYDMELKWTPDQSLVPPGTEIDTTGPSLFTALPEQLGLRLVPETGPVDTFVLESVQRPSEN